MAETDLRRLAEPFEPRDVSWRIQRAGKNENGLWAYAVAYVDSRAIQERLDAVVGPGGWSVRYERQPDGSVWAGITIGAVEKWDGTGAIPESKGISASDAAKGTLSVAFKRAAVAWGIGRYLYHLPAMRARTYTDSRGRFRAKLKDDTTYSWDPPELPAWASPGGDGHPEPPVQADPETGEIRDDAPPAATKPFPCPVCGGETWDNRENKTKPGSPDFVCKARRDCGWKVWLDGWGKELRRKAEAIPGGTLTLQEAGFIEAGLLSGDPHRLLAVHRKLEEIQEVTQ